MGTTPQNTADDYAQLYQHAVETNDPNANTYLLAYQDANAEEQQAALVAANGGRKSGERMGRAALAGAELGAADTLGFPATVGNFIDRVAGPPPADVQAANRAAGIDTNGPLFKTGTMDWFRNRVMPDANALSPYDPNDTLSNLTRDAAEGGTSAALTGGAGQIASGALAQTVGGGLARANAPAGVQVGASLAAGAAPSLAKLSLQGGLGVDPTKAQSNLSDLAAASGPQYGEGATVGLAAGPGSGAQAVEAASAHYPGSGPLTSTIQATNAKVAQQVTDIASNLGASDVTGTMGQVQDSLKSNYLPALTRRKQMAWDARADAVAPGTTVDPTKTFATLDKLRNQDANFGAYIDKDLNYQRLMDAAYPPNIRAELQPVGNMGGKPVWIVNGKSTTTQPTLADLKAQPVPFQVADNVARSLSSDADRSWVIGGEVSRFDGALNALSGTLSDDVSSSLKGQSKAVAADALARSVTKEVTAERARVTTVVGANTPENAFHALMAGSSEGPTILAAAYRGLSTDEQNALSATIFQRLGRPAGSKVVNAGELTPAAAEWNSGTFLTRWNNLDTGAKALLLKNVPPEYREQMDNIARYAANLKDSKSVYPNPSGTTASSNATALIHGTMMAVPEAATAALSGHYAAAAAAPALILVPLAGNMAGARLMSNPGFVRWISASTKLPMSSMPVILGQISKLGPEAAQFAQAAQDQYTQAQAPSIGR